MSNQILISSGAKLRDLDDVIIGTDGVLSSLGFNVANGVPKLDENGKILVSQLPNSVMEFKGVWNAATNTPTLADGTGNAGDVYLCNVAGTVNFGAGPITFAVGDYAVYTGTVWARSSGATGTVTSVGLSRDGDALSVTGSPITTSGTINIGFAGTNLQYINGAGNLVTFPDLTVYVPTSRTLTINDVTYDLSANRTWTIDSMIYPEEGIAVSTGTAWGDSIVDNSSNWNTAYNNSIVSAEVTGTTTKTLTLDQQDGGTITASWTDYDTAPVTSVFGRTGAVVAVSGDYTTAQVTESGNLYFTNARARAAISLTTLGTSGAATYNNTTGVLNIPNYTTDLTGYVPYTGATTNVNLGVHSLSAYDLIINHTSGSGVAASITKGGSGEALTVVKSSGSGNAASITGGVTLLSELHLTTDLADAYIASAANWNNAYNDSIISAAVTGTTTKTLTLNQQDGGTITASWTDYDTAPVTSVFGRTGAVVAVNGDYYIGTTAVQATSANQALTGITAINFLAHSDDGASISTTISGTSTYFDFNLLDDNTSDEWRWRFTPSGATVYNAMRLVPTTNTTANLIVSGTIGSSNFSGTHSGSSSGTNTGDQTLAGLGGQPLATNLTSLAGLTYASTSFVKMTAAGTFSLDTNTYALASALGNYLPLAGGTLTGPLEISYAGVGLKLRYNSTTYTDYQSDYINQNSAGANAWQFQFNGSSLFQIKSNGNFQLGTVTDAGYKFDVNGTGRFSGSVDITGTGDVLTLRKSNNVPALAFIGNSTNKAVIEGGDAFNFYTGNVSRLNIALTGAATFSNIVNVGYDNNNRSFLKLTSNAANRMAAVSFYGNNIESGYIGYEGGSEIISGGQQGDLVIRNVLAGKDIILDTNGGNVGIGTTSPGMPLQVSTSSTGTTVYFEQNSTGNGLQVTTSGTAGTSFIFKARSTGVDRFVISDTGITTIGGSVSGGGALQVNGNVNINGLFQINGVTIGGGGGSGVTGAGTTNYIPKWSGSTSLGNSSMYDNGGSIGIGTTTTSGKLHVLAGLTEVFAESTTAGNNAAFNVKTTARRWGIGANMALSSSWFEIYDYTAGANRFTISNVGNFLINTTTDNGYKINLNGSISFAYGFLSIFRGSSGAGDIFVGNDGSRIYIGGNTYVVGTVTATGGFFDTSDARLKTLVEDNYLLSSIASVKARLYIKDGRKELGYYAQDLEAILPSAVKEGSDGFLSLSYAQVHTAKIAVIEDEVTILKNRVSELETKLQKYEA
jgi:hypothetical protein